jgi:hypothetical protein
MAKALKARGHELVVLRGGPMDTWTVAPDAPVLAPDWRARFLEAAAEGLYLGQRERGDRTTWAELTDDQRGRFREGARLIHGAGHYELRRAEALAVWRTA